jgi:hypothetical protein
MSDSLRMLRTGSTSQAAQGHKSPIDNRAALRNFTPHKQKYEIFRTIRLMSQKSAVEMHILNPPGFDR